MDAGPWNSYDMLRHLSARRGSRSGEIPVWIKIRIDPTMSEHAIIDRYLETLGPARIDFEFEKHESGPEILTYVKLGTGLAAGVIGLIAAIINARAATHKKRELPVKPVELVVRHVDEKRGLADEVILRFDQKEADEAALGQKLVVVQFEFPQAERQR